MLLLLVFKREENRIILNNNKAIYYTLNLNLWCISLICNDLILNYLFCTQWCTHLEQGVCENSTYKIIKVKLHQYKTLIYCIEYNII